MNSRNKKILGTVIVALVLLSSALYYYDNVTAKNANNAGPISITDASGVTFTFNHTLNRIVSLDPAATATLYALGAYKDVVGGSIYSEYPPNSTVPNVENLTSINLEELVNLTPQAVLAPVGYFEPSLIDQINNTLHIPYITLNPQNMTAIEEQTTQLGKLTGTEENAIVINQWMNQSLSDLSNATSGISTSQELSVFYYEYSPGYWTAGNGTFINGFFNIAHLKNIANGSYYYQINPEVIANASPDVILLDQYVSNSSVDQAPFNETQAYIHNKIYTIFNDNFFDEPDFRVIYAIQWLIQNAYPTLNSTIPEFPISLQYPPTTGM